MTAPTVDQDTTATVGADVLELTAFDAHYLLKTSLVCTGTDRTVPVLCAVRLEVQGRYLLAVSTDRFRLGIARVGLKGYMRAGEPYTYENSTIPESDAPDSGFEAVLLDSADVKVAAAALKPGRREGEMPVTFTRRPDGGIDWENRYTGQSGRMRPVDASFPKWRGLIPDQALRAPSVLRTDPEPDGYRFMCNAAYLADFAKAAKFRGAPIVVEPTSGPNRPIVVRVGADFLGLIMPVRGGAGDQAEDRAVWVELLG